VHVIETGQNTVSTVRTLGKCFYH